MCFLFEHLIITRWYIHAYEGDMQLTKAEIAETQIIVTTPEKWDVVTRKPTGEGELASVSVSFILSAVEELI